jgi:DNA-binding CsgD family transcriptional regulator
VRAHLRLAEHRTALTRALDSLTEGLLVCTLAGRVVHQTPALRRLFDADPEAPRLQRELLRVGRLVGALGQARARKQAAPPPSGPACYEVRTVAARYRLHGSILGGGLLGPEPVVLAVLERLTAVPTTDAELRGRFGLSPREVQVARLAAAGKSNPEIARLLGVSLHTVRHQMERVIAKLGLTRRGEIAAKLRAE